MSLFRNSDYARKKEVVHKTRLPTQHRTINHKCSQCTRKDAKKYSIGEKDVRWLCVVCVIKHNNKDVREKPNFISAKQFWRKDNALGDTT